MGGKLRKAVWGPTVNSNMGVPFEVEEERDDEKIYEYGDEVVSQGK